MQQTPSTQKLEAHCSALVQLPPADLTATHTPPEQKLPPAQSLSTEQVVLQVAPPQVYGAHGVDEPTTHAPVPVQVLPAV